MTHHVRLAPLAINDLIGPHRWAMADAGRDVANGNLARIEARVGTLSSFPGHGTPRDDLYPGLRTLSIERRLLIAYQVDDAVIDVLRIIDAQRDVAPIPG